MLTKKTKRNLALFNREKARKPLYSAKWLVIETVNKADIFLKAYNDTKKQNSTAGSLKGV